MWRGLVAEKIICTALSVKSASIIRIIVSQRNLDLHSKHFLFTSLVLCRCDVALVEESVKERASKKFPSKPRHYRDSVDNLKNTVQCDKRRVRVPYLILCSHPKLQQDELWLDLCRTQVKSHARRIKAGWIFATLRNNVGLN